MGEVVEAAEEDEHGHGALKALSPEEIYVYAVVGLYSMYSFNMMFTPGKMATDHFKAPATPLLKFWIRGWVVPFICLAYAMLTELSLATNVKLAFGLTTGIAVIYPL